jgi:hypothetical protein
MPELACTGAAWSSAVTGGGGGPLFRRRIKPEGFFTNDAVLLGLHMPRRTDRWDRPVRKLVNMAK